MKILSIHTGHDSAVALYDDFKLIKIYKEERLSRIKQDGGKLPNDALNKISQYINFDEIDVVLFSKTSIPINWVKLNIFKKIEYTFIKNKKYISINSFIKKYSKKSIEELISYRTIRDDLKLKKDVEFYFYNHHFAHVIPTLFYSRKYNNMLLYSADGGGDFDYYGIYHFDKNNLHTIYADKLRKNLNLNSIGLMYTAVTEILGFKGNRHEGKITGLAAFGQHTNLVEEISKIFYVDKNGFIKSNLKNYKKDLKPYIRKIFQKSMKKEDLAFAAQYVLEKMIISSIKILNQKYKFTTIGLSGGVFANVKLNQKISELDFIEEIFVFPPMGDEGLVIGGVLEFLIKKKGFDTFLQNRKNDLEIPYWGDKYSILKNDIPDDFTIITENDIVKTSVEFLKNKKICAIFTKSMEYGPRALGARSILINPSDKSINDTVNKRLNRTEFMPFAPYVREERLSDVFDFPLSSKRAMKYMTVTCNVKDKYKEKIQATVHIDNTARPQSIKREDNPLYYDILYEFEKQTGIPCLVNTSFNAHEEPIINTFKEALFALKNNRIDYLITDNYIIGNK